MRRRGSAPPPPFKTVSRRTDRRRGTSGPSRPGSSRPGGRGRAPRRAARRRRRWRPEVWPAKRPSRRASSRAAANASSSLTAAISSARSSRAPGGTNPTPIPSSRCPPSGPPDRFRDVAGSTATQRTDGSRRFSNPATPEKQPPVPTPMTKPSNAVEPLDDLPAECPVCRGVAGIDELLRPPRVGLAGELGDPGLEAVEQLGRHLAAVALQHLDLRPERAHRPDLLRREAVGGDEVRPVAPGGADHRERASGAAAGVLDYPHAGLERPALLAVGDHPRGHPVLHAPGRVGSLPLRPELRSALGLAGAEPNEGRGARRIEPARHLAAHYRAARLARSRVALEAAVRPRRPRARGSSHSSPLPRNRARLPAA